jgi:thymidylate synthase
MLSYLDIVDEVLRNGIRKETRTGIDAFSIPGAIFQHDMPEGFPLLTTKKMPFRCIASELEFFIQGHTDKKWLQERGNHIWDEWCNPEIIPYSHNEETKKRMSEERDLGAIYGWQWRHYGARYGYEDDIFLMHLIKAIPAGILRIMTGKSFFRPGYEIDYAGRGFDQLKEIIDTLKTNPNDRRMIVDAWNRNDLVRMALPPCHYSWQVTVTGDKLNLKWNQRSVDTMLGLPFNIASYGLLLHLLAKESGLNEGRLTGFLGDVHIYENHLDKAKSQSEREPYKLPEIETTCNHEKFDIFKWSYKDSKIKNYKSHEKLEFPIAV